MRNHIIVSNRVKEIKHVATTLGTLAEPWLSILWSSSLLRLYQSAERNNLSQNKQRHRHSIGLVEPGLLRADAESDFYARGAESLTTFGRTVAATLGSGAKYHLCG